jgi:hypothetical protein
MVLLRCLSEWVRRLTLRRALLLEPLPTARLSEAKGEAVTPQARRELEQAFLRILRAREPGMVWTLAPDETQPVLDGGTPASARSGSDDRPIENGGE